MIDWAEIAADVAAGMGEAGFPATITRTAQGAYNPATDTYAETVTTLAGFVVVNSEAPVADAFPDYVAGPTDELLLVNVSAIAENDTITFQGVTRTVRRVKDVTGAGFLWNVVAR